MEDSQFSGLGNRVEGGLVSFTETGDNRERSRVGDHSGKAEQA